MSDSFSDELRGNPIWDTFQQPRKLVEEGLKRNRKAQGGRK